MKIKSIRILALSLALLTAAGCAAPGQTPGPETTAPVDSEALKADFYDAVNAEWLKTATIPADSPVVNSFVDLADDTEKVLQADFDKMLAGTPEKGTENFIEYYRMAIDFPAREALGSTPLEPYLARIDALESIEDLSALLAEWEPMGMPLPFTAYVSADMADASQNALHAAMPALILPGKSYYADENPAKQAVTAAYSDMMTELFALAGMSETESAQIIADTLAFDALLVPFAKSEQEASDYTSAYNPVPYAEFISSSGYLDLGAMFEELLPAAPQKIIVSNPEYFAAIDSVVNPDTFNAMKNWMKSNVVIAFSGYLTEDFRLASGSYARALMGTTESSPKEEAAFFLVSGVFSEQIGFYYGTKYFGEQAKADVTEMVEEFVEVYKNRIVQNTWLSETTKQTALRKLDTMAIHVGYPDKIDDIYAALVPNPELGLVENAMVFTGMFKLDNYKKLGQPVDRSKWPLSADTVNAMYSPTSNSINFPAAFLQAPFYSLENTPSQNYGGIGAVIAHEISHAFDPNGSKFDEFGSLADWWTEEDYAEFSARSAAMVAQFDGLSYAGGTVDGTLTVAENVADLGGLSCALEALGARDDANPEEFFKNWAVIWRMKATPEYEALLLSLDVHSPNKLRTNIQLQNFDEFYTTFDIKEGDEMYLAPSDRVAIW